MLAYRAIRSIPGVTIIKPLRHFARSNQDIFCTFEVHGEVFQIEEPYGDNSRFGVSACQAGSESSATLESVMLHFRNYRPWLLSLVGGG